LPAVGSVKLQLSKNKLAHCTRGSHLASGWALTFTCCRGYESVEL